MSVARGQKPGFDRIVEKAQQGIEKAAHIQQADGFFVEPELAPSPDFEELFERAEPARQRNESVGSLGHLPFAIVHVGHDTKLTQLAVGHFFREQGLRDHTEHDAPRRQCALGHPAHEPDSRTPVDQTPASVSDPRAQICGGADRDPAGARLGAAIDTD